MERLAVYKTWLLDKVLDVKNSDTLVLIPITTQIPDYRDQAAE
jgi:hypothetical protein